MGRLTFLVVLLVAILFPGRELRAQPAIPSFQPTSGTGGFDSGAIFGKAPPKPPEPPKPPMLDPTKLPGDLPEPKKPAGVATIPGVIMPPAAVLVPKLWTGSFEFGLNGSEGNSEVFKIRSGFDARRETASNILTLNTWVGLSNQNGIRTENKALGTLRDEILFGESRWSLYGQTSLEYDQFRDFDFRVALHAGAMYSWWKDDNGFFKTRLGAGAQREFGGQVDRWVPEGMLGYDFQRRLSDRQKFVSTADYYPSFERASDFRVRFRAAYEILVDPEHNLTLRLGVQDRFDSNPGTAKKNDVDYFATLLWGF